MTQKKRHCLDLHLQQEVPRHVRQTPQYGKISDYNLSRGDFIFLTGGTSGVSSSDSSTTKPSYSLNAEEELWRAVRDSNDISDLEMYLEEYPSGRFSKVSSLKIRKIREAAAGSTLTVKIAEHSSINPILEGGVPKEILDRGRLKVGMEPGYMPFELTTKAGKIVGFDVDIAKRMANDMGVSLELVSTAWNAIIPTLINESFDLIISGMTITKSRAEVIDFVPLITFGQSIVINKKLEGKVFSYQNLNSGKYSVVSKKGTTGEQAVLKKNPRAHYKGYATEQEAFMKVVNGRADAFVYDMPFNSIAVSQKGKGRTVHLEVPFTKEVLGIALRKNNKEFKIWLEQFVKKIKLDGTYERIYHAWFREDDWIREI